MLLFIFVQLQWLKNRPESVPPMRVNRKAVPGTHCIQCQISCVSRGSTLSHHPHHLPPLQQYLGINQSHLHVLYTIPVHVLYLKPFIHAYYTLTFSQPWKKQSSASQGYEKAWALAQLAWVRGYMYTCTCTCTFLHHTLHTCKYITSNHKDIHM